MIKLITRLWLEARQSHWQGTSGINRYMMKRYLLIHSSNLSSSYQHNETLCLCHHGILFLLKTHPHLCNWQHLWTLHVIIIWIRELNMYGQSACKIGFGRQGDRSYVEWITFIASVLFVFTLPWSCHMRSKVLRTGLIILKRIHFNLAVAWS